MAVRELGEDRVVFGTDLAGADYCENLGRVLQCEFPDAVQAKILAGNFEGKKTAILEEARRRAAIQGFRIRSPTGE